MALLNVEVFRPQAGPALRLVAEVDQSWREGAGWAARRTHRAVARRRRRVAVAIVALGAGLVMLGWPGAALGGMTGTGLPSDLATGSSLASGMVYVVQSGDTVESIATALNPINPAFARAALVRELHSDVVVPGEHVLIP